MITSLSKHGCVYYGLPNHKREDCTKVLNVARRKEILINKRLCYNCISYGQSAANCQSGGCRKCSKKHHTLICQSVNATMYGKVKNKKESMGKIFYASTARIMLDTGAGSSYIWTNLLTKLKLKPTRKEYKNIKQVIWNGE
nr:uncharacterized protein LOC105844171 [Hydra vulgaris]